MGTRIVAWSLVLAALYLGLGLVFAVHFVLRRVGRVDPDAREGTWGFRLLILPGVTALWPLLLRRAEVAPGELPEARERTAHRLAARRGRG